MRTVLATFLGLVVGLAACSEGDRGPGDRPTIVVTTTILGDVVRNLVGERAEVEVLMPPNVDPHDFAASAQQVAAVREADALVVNGLGFEEGLLDVIEAAADDSVRVISAADAVEPIPLAGEEAGDDPHLFTDPVRMREAAALIAEALVTEVPALDTPSYQDRVDGYLAELEALDADIEAVLADIPADRRVLITNHEVFGYFADRYGFEVLGAIIPGGSTLAEPGAADLDELVRDIDERAVPAIFADTSSPRRLAEALAAEGADVTVVELYSESLGEEGSAGDTYIGMVRTNAERIAAALG